MRLHCAAGVVDAMSGRDRFATDSGLAGWQPGVRGGGSAGRERGSAGLEARAIKVNRLRFVACAPVAVVCLGRALRGSS